MTTDNTACNNSNVNIDDHDADNDCSDNGKGNQPLLSTSFRQSVKMGPFSIKYSDPSSPRAKPTSVYEEHPSSRSSLYHDFAKDSDDNSDDDDYRGQEKDQYEEDAFHHYHSKQQTSIVHIILHKLFDTKCCQTYFLPLRILLLAVYLAFTLSTFWILDSIKEPTLAILVDGELGKHQPRAKMVSFVVVVAMAVGMEWADRVRQHRRRAMAAERQMRQQQQGGVDDELEGVNEALEKSWADRNLPRSMQDDNGGNKWKRMGIRTSNRFWKHFRWGIDDNNEDEAGNASSKITTLAFYVVGSLYIHLFVTVAVALRQHPSFRPNNTMLHETDDNTNVATDDLNSETHGDWYYPSLGYILFALIESYGSVSITIFWAFANSHLTLETAERHYGSIVAVAQAGAIGGSTLSAILGSRRRGEDNVIYDAEGRVDVSVADVGSGMEEQNDAQVTPTLIFWACGCIGCGMAIMALYARLFSRPMNPSTPRVLVGGDANNDGVERRAGEDFNPPTVQLKQKPDDSEGTANNNEGSNFRDLFGGVRMIFRNEYLTLVLAVSVLYEIALTCMHYEMNLIGLDRFGVGISIVDEFELNDERDYQYTISDNDDHNDQNNGSDEGITYIQFMGWYGQTVNVLSLFLSFFAFPRLIKHYGLSFTIRVFPTVLLVVTFSAFVIFPGNLYFLFVSLSLCKALTYSVHDPSEEVLYMPTSDDAKFRAKFWIDVVGQRIAKAAGSTINNYAGSVEGILKYGSLPSLVASLALWLACYQVGIVFDRLIKSGDVVGLEEEGERCRENESLELCDGVAGGEQLDIEVEITPTASDLTISKLETTLL